VALAFVTLSPDAGAQTRRPGDYLMVGGTIQGRSTNIIYVLDTANLEVLGLEFNSNRNRVENAIWHDIKADLQQGESR
jgi:hypothetical protein